MSAPALGEVNTRAAVAGIEGDSDAGVTCGKGVRHVSDDRGSCVDEEGRLNRRGTVA